MMYFVTAGQNNFTPRDKSQKLTLAIPELARHRIREAIGEILHCFQSISLAIKKNKIYLKLRTRNSYGKNACEIGLTWSSRSRQNTCNEFRWEQWRVSLKSQKNRPWASIRRIFKNVPSKQTWVVVKSKPSLNAVSILVDNFTRENTFFRRGICTYVVHVSIYRLLDLMLKFHVAAQTWVKAVSYKVLVITLPKNVTIALPVMTLPR